MDIQIPENLQSLFTSLSFYPAKLIKIRFSEDYGNKEIVSPFILKDPTPSLRKLEKKVKESVGLSVSEYNLLEDFICSKITDLDIEETKQPEKAKEKIE